MNPRKKNATFVLAGFAALAMALFASCVSPAKNTLAVCKNLKHRGVKTPDIITRSKGVGGYFPSIAFAVVFFASAKQVQPPVAVESTLVSQAHSRRLQQQKVSTTMAADVADAKSPWSHLYEQPKEELALTQSGGEEPLRWKGILRRNPSITDASAEREGGPGNHDWLPAALDVPPFLGQDAYFGVEESGNKNIEQKSVVTKLPELGTNVMLPEAVEEQENIAVAAPQAGQPRKGIKLQLSSTLQLARTHDGRLLCGEGGVYGFGTSAGGMHTSEGVDAQARVAIRMPQTSFEPAYQQEAPQILASFASAHTGDAQAAGVAGTRLVLMCRTANQPVVATLPTAVNFINRTELLAREEQKNAVASAARWREVTRYTQRAYGLLRVAALASLVAVGIRAFMVSARTEALLKAKNKEDEIYGFTGDLGRKEVIMYNLVTFLRKAPPPGLRFHTQTAQQALENLSSSVIALRVDVKRSSFILSFVPVAYLALTLTRRASDRTQKVRDTAIRQWKRRRAGVDVGSYESKEENTGIGLDERRRIQFLPSGGEGQAQMQAPMQAPAVQLEGPPEQIFRFFKQKFWSSALEEAEQEYKEEEDQKFFIDEKGTDDRPFVSPQGEIESYNVELVLPMTGPISSTVVQPDTPITLVPA